MPHQKRIDDPFCHKILREIISNDSAKSHIALVRRNHHFHAWLSRFRRRRTDLPDQFLATWLWQEEAEPKKDISLYGRVSAPAPESGPAPQETLICRRRPTVGAGGLSGKPLPQKGWTPE